jgi:hypothetical protein
VRLLTACHSAKAAVHDPSANGVHVNPDVIEIKTLGEGKIAREWMSAESSQ